MRPVEFTDEQVIEAGRTLQAQGRNITGFALRKLVGGGDPTRLKQRWDAHQASTTAGEPETFVELPIEVANVVDGRASRTQPNRNAPIRIMVRPGPIRQRHHRAGAGRRPANATAKRAGR